MKFTARIANPHSVVVYLSIELNLSDANQLIEQLDQIKDGAFTPWPARMVKDGLAAVVEKLREKVTEELVPERQQG